MSSRPGSVRSFTVDASSAGSDTTRTTPPPSSPTDQPSSGLSVGRPALTDSLVAAVVPVRMPVVFLLGVPGMRPDHLDVGRMHPAVSVRKREHARWDSMRRQEEPGALVPSRDEPGPVEEPEVLSGVEVDRSTGLDDEHRLGRDEDRLGLRNDDSTSGSSTG